MNELVEPRSVSMYSLQWATVEALARDNGYPSVSAALRRIVEEWVEMRQFQELARSVLRARVAGHVTAEEAVEALTSRVGLLDG